ncbi:MAG: PaaI family thioesterase [Carboxydocellales bacterium]
MNFRPKDDNYVEKVRDSFGKQQFMDFIGARLYEVHPGYCEIHLDFKPELSQQGGFFHGGIIGTIADNAGGYAAHTLMPSDYEVLTVEYKLNIIAPGKGEKLIACGHVVKSGKTLTICRTDVFVLDKGHKKLCATSLMTLFAIPNS